MGFSQEECLHSRTPPGVLMWGFLKEKVWINSPRSLEDLKRSTEQALAGTDQLILRKSIYNNNNNNNNNNNKYRQTAY